MDKLVRSQIEHVVLPPRLPGKREKNLLEIENALHDRLLEAAECVCLELPLDASTLSDWETMIHALAASKSINEAESLDKTILQTQLRDLVPGQTLIMHISEQNAGLLMRYVQGKHGM